MFSSTKSFTGHTTSASGSIEAVICLLAINHGFVPKNIGYNEPIKDFAVPVTETLKVDKLSHVISNSFGFGGNDSTLIFTKHSK
jgi:3-oxoacyl-(acyl-carrier-protein) synthase